MFRDGLSAAKQSNKGLGLGGGAREKTSPYLDKSLFNPSS